MTACYPSSIREEELKNKVAADFFGAFAPIPSDSFDDTDHDTLLDYDEVYGRGMDPFLVDTDGDGILDALFLLLLETSCFFFLVSTLEKKEAKHGCVSGGRCCPFVLMPFKIKLTNGKGLMRDNTNSCHLI